MIASTSLEALKKFQPKIKTDHDKILSKLSKNRCFTSAEIASMLGWESVKVARRMPELVRLKKAEIEKVRKCIIGGNNCRAYVKL